MHLHVHYALIESKTETHCQARQCSENYFYFLNHEDICYKGYLPYYFLYNDGNEIYYKACYETCEVCSNSGNKLNNNFDSCRNGYIFHPNKKFIQIIAFLIAYL